MFTTTYTVKSVLLLNQGSPDEILIAEIFQGDFSGFDVALGRCVKEYKTPSIQMLNHKVGQRLWIEQKTAGNSLNQEIRFLVYPDGSHKVE